MDLLYYYPTIHEATANTCALSCNTTHSTIICMFATHALMTVDTPQDLAVDLLYYYPTVHEATARTCALLCLTDSYSTQLALRVIDSLCAKGRQPDNSAVISFLATVVLGRVSQAQLTVEARRHAVLVTAVCRAMTNIASPGQCVTVSSKILGYLFRQRLSL